ncbi:O-methyltransferase [Winogradskyella rapida]|uniref:O-methyltransferase n=1 Tax=Winogradskyella rapida TaxID=549701 RepID=A0ABW3KLD2_9FLAO
MYQFKSYIKFLTKASNQHGVHSPFVYSFVTKCLYNKTAYLAYDALASYRKELRASDTILEVTDLGEGSKVLDATQRKVSEMVKVSSSSKKEVRLLYRIAKYFNFKTSLELGTSLGIGTYALALANPESKITSIEGCPNTSAFAQSQLKAKTVQHVDLISGPFKTKLPHLKAPSYDFIYFDGHHNKTATLNYFETLLAKAHNDSVFIFDDIYWSKGMTEAWEHIKHHEGVTVTVDTFYMGIVFFRKEQKKEHFKIRL